METPFRLGLVGIGDMAGIHGAAAQRIGIDLAVAAGSNRERAASMAESTGATLHESYDALLADPAVTAVDLCVPNDRHRAYAERAFAAGKHVLCEKPIALTLADADAMIASAKAVGVLLMIGHVVRFWPEYRRTRELYLAGDLGKLTWLSLRRLTGVLSATQGSEGWRGNPARSGGAALDLQIHDLDFLCWLLGPPSSVFARGVQSAPGSWDHVMTTLTFPGDIQAVVEASFLMGSYPFDLGFHALSDRGTLAYRYSPASFALHGLHGDAAEESESGASLLLYEPGATAATELFRPGRDAFEVAIDDEIGAFVSGVRAGRLDSCTGEEARLALSVSLASLRSCETGQVVRGPF